MDKNKHPHRIDLLPCPFCGHPPKWIEMSGWPGFGIYECVNRDCYMVARSVGSQGSLQEWNRRANAEHEPRRGAP